MIKIYGMPTCPYCAYVDEQVKGDKRFKVIDIGENVRCVRPFQGDWRHRYPRLRLRGRYRYPQARRRWSEGVRPQRGRTILQYRWERMLRTIRQK